MNGLPISMSSNSAFKINASDSVICIASSEDGNKIAFGDRSGNVSLATKEGEVLWEKKIDEGIYGVAIMKDGNRVVCGGKDCKLRMFNSLGNVEWDVNVGKSIWSLSVDPNGQVIVVGTGDSIAIYAEGGAKLWEYETSRAMVGVGVSRNGTNVVGCGDEFLYCLDSEGNLLWKKQRSDALWDVNIEKDGNVIVIGGWDCNVHSLDLHGNEIWNYETKGYVRSVKSMDDGGVLAGSHDHKIYQLNDKGELLEIYDTGGEITCISTCLPMDMVFAGTGNRVLGFQSGTETNYPIENSETNISIEEKVEEAFVSSEVNNNESENEPMFGFGMFDEPSPDVTGILENDNYNESQTTTNFGSNYSETHRNSSPYYQDSNETVDEGGEYREFAAKIVKGDVKNYLRLGNAAWLEKRLERAAEHFRRATEISPEEPRAWHNLAVCNYHLALKRNPDDLENAVESAIKPLEMAKEKGGDGYNIVVDKTLLFLASKLATSEEIEEYQN